MAAITCRFTNRKNPETVASGPLSRRFGPSADMGVGQLFGELAAMGIETP